MQKIIDVHAHIFPGKIVHKAVDAIGDFYSIPMDGIGTGEDLVRRGREIGVEKYVVHSAATTPAQVPHINDFIAHEMQAHPEFIGLATLHPFMEGAAEEYDRALAMGLRGLKLHPDFQEFNIDDPQAMEMYKIVQGRGTILFHVGDETRDFSSPTRLARVLDAMPGLSVIAAHMGGYQAWDEARACLLGRDVYIDSSSALFKLDPVEAADMMRAHGMDKVLFGTDYPMWIHKEELERFMRVPLTDAEREKVLYTNAARLFGVESAAE